MMEFQMLFYGIITIMICPSLYTKDDIMSAVHDHQSVLDWLNKIRTSGSSSAENSSRTRCNCSLLARLLGQLGWRSIIVIYDKPSDYLLHKCTEQMEHIDSGVVLESHEIKDHNINTSFLAFLLDAHQRLFPRLDFLVLTSDVTVWNILTYVNRVDSFSNRTTDFNYHSKWLVLLKSGRIDNSVYSLHSLQNVAFIKTVCDVKNLSNHTTIRTLVHYNKSTSLRDVSRMHNVNNSVVFPALNYGYNGRRLTVSTLSVSTFMQAKTINNITKYSGFCIYLLDALADSLNFTYELIEPTDGTWGVLVSNASWNGLVGQMERREADLALADLTIRNDRSKVMDFLLPPFYYDYTDIMYKEESGTATWLTLLRPFSPIVFLWIAVCTSGFIILYSSAMVLVRDQYGFGYEPKTCSDVLWYTISSLLKQGTSINPSSHSIRVLVSSWLLFVGIIVAEYTGNLTAAFTVRPGIKPFESLGQLLEYPNYKIGIFQGSITTMVLKNSNNMEYRKAWSKMVEDSKEDPEVFSENVTKQVEKIKRGNYAFILNDASLRTHMAQNCGLQRLGLCLDWQPVSFGVPKNSTLKMDFEQTMRLLETSGIFTYAWKLHQSRLRRPVCPSRQRSVHTSITLEDMKSGFILLGVGICAAFILLVVEIFRNNFTFSR